MWTENCAKMYRRIVECQSWFPDEPLFIMLEEVVSYGCFVELYRCIGKHLNTYTSSSSTREQKQTATMHMYYAILRTAVSQTVLNVDANKFFIENKHTDVEKMLLEYTPDRTVMEYIMLRRQYYLKGIVADVGFLLERLMYLATPYIRRRLIVPVFRVLNAYIREWCTELSAEKLKEKKKVFFYTGPFDELTRKDGKDMLITPPLKRKSAMVNPTSPPNYEDALAEIQAIHERHAAAALRDLQTLPPKLTNDKQPTRKRKRTV